jgi:cytochrome c-type biogenesis protein CcmH
MKRRIFLLSLLASPALALEPSEMLPDPKLEARARVLDHEIRCVQCQSEVVASSNAVWAQDARRMIRELVSQGASDAEVKSWFLQRYGEYVLMNPSKTGSTLALWLAGPLMFTIATLGAFAYIKGRAKPSQQEESAALSASEQAKLDEILNK